MKLVPMLGWRFNGDVDEALDDRLLPLLDAIATTGSLAAAVAVCGISYRAGWGLLRDYGRMLGAPLVHLERGRGASVTGVGEQLLRAQTIARERLTRILPGLAIDLGSAKRRDEGRPVLRLRVAASHDLALALLVDSLPASGIELELSVMGSLHAL